MANMGYAFFAHGNMGQPISYFGTVFTFALAFMLAPITLDGEPMKSIAGTMPRALDTLRSTSNIGMSLVAPLPPQIDTCLFSPTIPGMVVGSFHVGTFPPTPQLPEISTCHFTQAIVAIPRSFDTVRSNDGTLTLFHPFVTSPVARVPPFRLNHHRLSHDHQ